MPGTLFVVATPIGNLEDITLRALRVLRAASVIAAEDTRRTAILLQRHDIRTPTISFHEHNERQRTGALLRRLEAGDAVAIVSDAGTPLISDPGARLVEAALQAGIRVEPIPGPSAVAAALAASGLDTGRFTFVGFSPARAGARSRWFESLRDVPGVLVYFEAPQRIRGSLEDLRRILGERQIVVARELTKIHESITRAWVSEVLANPLPERGEFTIIVSDLKRADKDYSSSSSDDDVVHEFGRLTESNGLSSRDAVAALATKLARQRQDVYALLRRAGKVG